MIKVRYFMKNLIEVNYDKLSCNKNINFINQKNGKFD